MEGVAFRLKMNWILKHLILKDFMGKKRYER